MTYPKRLIEVDLPIKRISAMHSGRSRSGMGHLDAAHLVGTTAAGGLPGGDLRIALARPGRRELPPGLPRRPARLITAFAEGL